MTQEECFKFRDQAGDTIELAAETDVVAFCRRRAVNFFSPDRMEALTKDPKTDELHIDDLFLVRREHFFDNEFRVALQQGAIRPLFKAPDGYRIPRPIVEVRAGRSDPARKAIERAIFSERISPVQQLEDLTDSSRFEARSGQWRDAYALVERLLAEFPGTPISIEFLKLPTSIVAAPRESGP